MIHNKSTIKLCGGYNMINNKKTKLHKIIMILCCTIPFLTIGLLYFFRLQGTSWGTILGFGAILLCPLMHLLMLPLIMRGMKSNKSEDNKPSCH